MTVTTAKTRMGWDPKRRDSRESQVGWYYCRKVFGRIQDRRMLQWKLECDTNMATKKKRSNLCETT